MKVCILMGGASNEREVSIFSGKELLKHIDKEKYCVSVLDIPPDGSVSWVGTLLDDPPDIVLSALHGGLGENGAVQGLLECLHIPYVGSKVMSSAICLNKHVSKMLMRANHIPVANDVLIKKKEDLLLYQDVIQNEIGFPLIVKPNNGGSSIDMGIAVDKATLDSSVLAVLASGDDALLEEFIDGQEVTVGIVEGREGLKVLPVLDIHPNAAIFDYKSKYFDGSSAVVDFSVLPDFLKTMIAEIAKKAYILLNCHGYGRVDMMVKEEQVTVLELNTLPGLTSHSLIPKAASGGIGGFSEFIDGLITFELSQ